jgi:hypothetical protein
MPQPLSPGERVDLKKRLIRALNAESWADARLIFQEFHGPEQQPNFEGDEDDDVRWRIDRAGEEKLIELDEYFSQRTRHDQPMFSLSEDAANTPFDETEQTQIAEVVARVLTQAKEEFELPEQELHGLEGTLPYVGEAPRWIRGRVDWINLTVGVFVNKVADGALTEDTMRKVLHALAAGVGPLFGHPMPLLPP